MSFAPENQPERTSADGKQREFPISPEDTISDDFLIYASRLWGARRFILSVTITGSVLSIILAFTLPKQYESSTSLMPPANRSSSQAALLASVAGPLASAGSTALGLQTPGALDEQVLRSRTVQDYLINRFDLRQVYHTATYKDTRLKLAANTEISSDQKSGVITVVAKAPSPQLAVALAQGYVDELNTLMVQLDTSAAHRERLFLENRLKDVEMDLETDSAQLGQFSSHNAVVVGSEQDRAIMTSVETLRGQVIEAKAQLAALQQVYSSDNERVRAARAKFDELQHELARIRGSAIPDSSQDVDGFPSIRALPLLGVKYASLYRHLQVQESVYETLTKQYEMTKVEEARDLPTVRVLDSADLPEQKSSPRRSILVLLGTFVACLLASAYVLVQRWWTDSNSPWKDFLRK